MAIFTNSYGFGGNFLTHLERMLDASSEAYIAVGYTSANTVDRISSKAERICRSGGTFKLLVGTPYFEGLSQSNYDALQSLHRCISQYNNASEVRLSIDILYHGKIYDFVTVSHSIFAGSSNLSPAGLSGNLEFMSQLQGEDLSSTQSYLEFLMSSEQSAPINRIQGLTIHDSPQYKRIVTPTLDDLPQYKLPVSVPSRFIEIPFGNMDEKQRSGLNAYFGKGRLQRSTGIIKPRPWFEVEIIASTGLTASPDYPKGEFTVITDDGYMFECKTSGDNYKNFRSKGDLEILGRWIKGKLQRKGLLAPFSPITTETLLRYGRSAIRLYPIGPQKYFMEF